MPQLRLVRRNACASEHSRPPQPPLSQLNAFLYQVDFIVSVLLCVVILWALYRAYVRTRFSGLLVWALGTFISLCNVTAMHTLGRDRQHVDLARVVLLSFRTLWIVDSVLIVVGTVMVLLKFTRLSDTAKHV